MKREIVILILLLLAVPLAARADLESEINARYRGGYVVVKLPIASNCDDYYNDNDVVGSQVDSKSRRRFESGEVARVERVGAHRGRVDVFLDLNEQILDEIHDGPFTLYEPRSCKIQLRIPVPDRSGASQVEARLGDLLELHDSAREAEASKAWNGRRRPPFPEGYEKTLADYQAWKAAQRNAAVRERMDSAIEEASQAADNVRTDAEYLQGFAEGMEKGRDAGFGDCGSLVDASFSSSSGGSGKGSDWRRGYDDGQHLGWNLELLRRLRECFVPVP